MTHRFLICCAAVLLGTSAAVVADESLRIVPIVRDDTVFVSFELGDSLPDDVRGAISSGLRTTLTYQIELRMIVPIWIDRTIATTLVSLSDQYDNLTRRHTLSRMVDGRVEDTLVTEDESVARRWLTRLSRMPLCETSKLEPNRDYYVLISARARPHGGSLFGWVNTIVGKAKFTFIP
jgi:hypothetical protein